MVVDEVVVCVFVGLEEFKVEWDFEVFCVIECICVGMFFIIVDVFVGYYGGGSGGGGNGFKFENLGGKNFSG